MQINSPTLNYSLPPRPPTLPKDEKSVIATASIYGTLLTKGKSLEVIQCQKIFNML